MKKLLLLRRTVLFLLLLTVSTSTVFGIKDIDFVNFYMKLISRCDIETHSDELILNEIDFYCKGDITLYEKKVTVDIIRRMDFIEKNTNYRIESKIRQGLEKVIFRTISNEVIILFFNIRHRDDRFRNEVSILTDLNHDNIIKIRGVNYEQFYFVQDLATMDFLDLIDKVRSGEIGLFGADINKIIIKILKDIISGLYYLHQNNIVHRDIKPENILLFYNSDEIYTAKIIDFSFAVKIPEGENNIQLRTLSGSLFYVPPRPMIEHLRNVWYFCSYSDDIYSFGIVLYITYYRCGVRGFYEEQHQESGSNLDFMSFYINYLIKGLRPSLDCDYLDGKNGVNILIKKCWNTDASVRPSSEEIYEILCGMIN